MALSKVAWILTSVAALVALAIQLAPGEELSEWSTRQPEMQLLEKSKSSDDNDDGVLVEFSSRSETLVGRLFYPENKAEDPLPVVILAHGLGLTQDCSLTGFVEGFVEAGFAAFTFDYATFGMSSGVPRHQVHPENHIMDLKAAIATLRERASLLQLDASRIGLWGTSMGGGHVIRVAAESEGIRAVVAQVPQLASGAESVLLGTLLREPAWTALGLVKVLAAAVRWIVQWMMGSSWYVPLVGVPESSGLMQNEGDFEGYLSLCPENGGNFDWRNAATLPSAIRILTYRPLDAAKNVRSPILLIAAEEDTLCPTSYVDTARKAMNRHDTEVMIVPEAQHFDLYHGELHKNSVESAVKFLQKHMLH